MKRICLVLFLLFTIAGCSGNSSGPDDDTQAQVIPASDTPAEDPESSDDTAMTISLKGEYVTDYPEASDFPMRILIAIDCSGSMDESDPVEGDGVPERVRAARQVIDYYKDNPAVKFSVILWNHSVVLSGFTQNAAYLDEMFDSLTNDASADYRGAISSVRGEIWPEISNMMNNEQTANVLDRTSVRVLFLSDGPPGEGIDIQRAEVLRNIQELQDDLSGLNVADFHLHTFFLSALYDKDSNEYLDTLSLLTDMAAEGQGQCFDIRQAEDIDFFISGVLDREIGYSISSVVATNVNVLPIENAIWPDSDGDGLSDQDEPSDGNGYVTNPLLMDSDEDGYSDFTETRLASVYDYMNPVTPSENPCRDTMLRDDSDKDGLYDCDEWALGTCLGFPDTDYDGLPDGIEYVRFMNPHTPVADEDSDADGMVDWMEILIHSQPFVSDAALQSQFGYSYTIKALSSAVESQTGYLLKQTRHSFTISNIHILDTLETGEHGSGQNLIRVNIFQTPTHAPGAKPLVRMAELVVNAPDDSGKTIEISAFENIEPVVIHE